MHFLVYYKLLAIKRFYVDVQPKFLCGIENVLSFGGLTFKIAICDTTFYRKSKRYFLSIKCIQFIQIYKSSLDIYEQIKLTNLEI